MKEKFGTLRFNIRRGDGYVRGLIDMACALSARVCDECGSMGFPPGTADAGVGCRACRGCEVEEVDSPVNPDVAMGLTALGTETAAAGATPEVFRLPKILTPSWRHLGAELERVIDFDMRHNEMPPIFIDAVIETETLAFRWRGGDDKGRAAGFFRMVEAFSARCDQPRLLVEHRA